MENQEVNNAEEVQEVVAIEPQPEPQQNVQVSQTTEQKLSLATGYSPEEIGIIKNTVAKGTTNTELAYFLMLSKSVGLNPFKKEIWCYKQNNGELVIFAGRDGFLTAAQKSDSYGGMRSAYVCENDEFAIDIPNGVVKHTFGTGDRGKIIGGWALAFRKGCEATLEWADIKTYDKGYNTWKSHKGAMIQKVAECTALKKGFGLPGIVSEYELDSIKERQSASIVSTDEIIEMYNNKAHLLTTDERAHAERIINNKEENSYPKLLQLLQSK